MVGHQSAGEFMVPILALIGQVFLQAPGQVGVVPTLSLRQSLSCRFEFSGVRDFWLFRNSRENRTSFRCLPNISNGLARRENEF
jgi:hypothetical protein